jgi:hypothetical protein
MRTRRWIVLAATLVVALVAGTSWLVIRDRGGARDVVATGSSSATTSTTATVRTTTTTEPTTTAPPTTAVPTTTTTVPPTTVAPTTEPTTTAPPPTTVPPTTVLPTTMPPTTVPPTTVPPSGATLRLGASGPEVVALQERLLSLGYWLPAADGDFGQGTHHAVVAFQKVHGFARDGIVGPVTSAAIASAGRPTSVIGSGVEVELARQVLLVVQGGSVVWAFDTSTGAQAGTTPIGTFSVTREIDGMRVSELGSLWRPKYFYGGVAIHGYTSVPPQPASHGCVRVTYPAMDAIWASGLVPVGTPVVVHG